ncbi:MAG: 1-(5-phosphoribosyl)-5-[(5-phosphoribosylamino)methylideneamino] imidazole-4-carboxamide isomerase [Alphaproteobacteria bacterium GM7ARS4]|nr:1-(5-phosphoribosyl)-5-[(5-phosphoribosylamino)methylideneamino] imidazole-4-carboxamide isomerase [Alphaproteobacteria bacterium GM7ARS4]
MPSIIVYPAIDMRGGRCVRLRQGDFSQETVYHHDIVAQARFFWEKGARWLHMVDLDGAVKGQGVNSRHVEAVLAACPGLNIQLGGGIRSVEDAERWLEKGVAHVVFGTFIAVLIECRDGGGRVVSEFASLCARYRGRINVSLDCRGRCLAYGGWKEQSAVSLSHAVDVLKDYEVAAIIYTDIHRDGVLAGPDIEGLSYLASLTDIPLIASGGIRSLDDMRCLATSGVKTLRGIISGRAFYAHHVAIEEVLSLYPHA